MAFDADRVDSSRASTGDDFSAFYADSRHSLGYFFLDDAR